MPSTTGITNSAYVIRNRWAWGQATNGAIGNNTTTPNTSTPSAINTEGDWATLRSGNGYSVGIRLGKLYSWGNNTSGRTGQGSATGSTNVPTQIGSAADWVAVAAGAGHAFAIKEDGTLWAWGLASNGALGNNTTTPNITSPTQIGSNTNWSAVSAGLSHSLGLQSDGTLWAWGGAANGKLGNNTTTPDVLVPTQIGSDSDWSLIECGQQSSYAIKTNGKLYSWGGNANGQTGQNTSIGDTLTPTQVGSDSDWEQITANNCVTAVKGGQLYGWGFNAQGAVGDNSTTNRTTPQLIDSNTGWRVGHIGKFGTGGAQQSCAIRDGKLFTWGNDTSGVLGNGAPTANVLVPTQIGTDTDWQLITMGLWTATGIKG